MKRIDYILDFCKELGKEMISCGANIERVDLCMDHLMHAYGLHDVTCANLTTRISISAKDDEKNYAHRQTDVPPQVFNLERLKKLNHLYYHVKENTPDVTTLYDLLHDVKSNDFPWFIMLGGYLVAMAALARLFLAGPTELLITELNTVILFFLSRLASKIRLNKIVTNFVCMFLCSMIAMLFFASGFIGNFYIVVITNAFFLIPGIQMVNCARNLLCGNEMNGVIDLLKVILEVCTIVAGMAAAYAILGNLVGSLRIQEFIDALSQTNLLRSFELVGLSFIASAGFGVVFNIQWKDLIYAAIGGTIVRIVYISLQAAIPEYRFIYTIVAAFCAALYSEVLAIVKKEPGVLYRYPSIIPLIPGDLFFYVAAGIIWGDTTLITAHAPNLGLVLVGISLGFVLCSTVVHYVRKAKFMKLITNSK